MGCARGSSEGVGCPTLPFAKSSLSWPVSWPRDVTGFRLAFCTISHGDWFCLPALHGLLVIGCLDRYSMVLRVRWCVLVIPWNKKLHLYNDAWNFKALVGHWNYCSSINHSLSTKILSKRNNWISFPSRFHEISQLGNQKFSSALMIGVRWCALHVTWNSHGQITRFVYFSDWIQTANSTKETIGFVPYNSKSRIRRKKGIAVHILPTPSSDAAEY